MAATVAGLFLVTARAADIENGEALFNEHCAACHTVMESVRDKSGPNLNGVVGRKAGTEDYGHGYTEELMASGVTWGIETLQAFLNSPALMVRGTKMVFRGLPDAAARLDIACYLERGTVADETTPNALCAVER
ncbi:MAG: c-type cytochrome [Acidimicrobiia bacterium]